MNELLIGLGVVSMVGVGVVVPLLIFRLTVKTVVECWAWLKSGRKSQ